MPVITAPVPAPAPIAPTVNAPLRAAAAPVADDGLSGSEAAALGLVGLAAMAGAGLFAAGRRRRRLVDEGAGYEEFEQVEPSLAPVDRSREREATVSAPWAVAANGAPSPERFVMPAGPVPIGAERDALLARMVAAPPDEANPFRSTKGRRRRARMILAARERELAQDARKPFDWRTYTPSAAQDRETTKPATVPS